MRNYIKSEWYRIFHSREIYVITAVCSGLLLLLNIVMILFTVYDPAFPWANARFAFNNLTAMLNVLMFMGVLLVYVLFANEKQNGTMKNAVAYGISRRCIFLGKCLVCTGAALVSMIAILLVLIVSSALMLEGPVLLPLQKMLEGIGAALLSAIASLILGVVLHDAFSKEFVGGLLWYAVLFFIPKLMALLGLKYEAMRRIARWLPGNFLSSEVVANTNRYQCLWNTPEGLFRCIFAGVAGIVIFGAAGLYLAEKREIK